ncbi:MAG: hypothetical protein ACOYMG_11235 [Candidatus Methylumidiphilus sp.]
MQVRRGFIAPGISPDRRVTSFDFARRTDLARPTHLTQTQVPHP